MADAHDLVVIGSGPAGLAAAIAAGRRGLTAVVFEAESVGGELVNRHTIENLPGRPETTGPDLRETLVEQLREVGGEVRLAAVEAVRGIDGRTADTDAGPEAARRPFTVETGGGGHRARAVLVATGGRPVRLALPGAEPYRGRGIFYCAMCDGPLYADEVVAVAGGDDWALIDALYLTEHADSVVVIEERPRLPAAEPLLQRAREHPDIEVLTDTELRGVGGEAVLERLELFDRTEDAASVLPVGGLYVQRGVEPETAFLPDSVSVTDCGAVEVDQSLATAVPGLFAAGDVRQSSPRTVAAALGDGVTACRSAARYLGE